MNNEDYKLGYYDGCEEFSKWWLVKMEALLNLCKLEAIKEYGKLLKEGFEENVE